MLLWSTCTSNQNNGLYETRVQLTVVWQLALLLIPHSAMYKSTLCISDSPFCSKKTATFEFLCISQSPFFTRLNNRITVFSQLDKAQTLHKYNIPVVNEVTIDHYFCKKKFSFSSKQCYFITLNAYLKNLNFKSS